MKPESDAEAAVARWTARGKHKLARLLAYQALQAPTLSAAARRRLTAIVRERVAR